VTFLSIEWLGWMILTVAAFWLTPFPARFYVLAVITLAFLLVYSPLSAGLLVLLTATSYLLTRAQPVRGRDTTVAIGIVVAVLATYKLRASAVTQSDLVGTAVIPLGLSYYSFRTIHYILERYKGTVSHPRLAEYVSYLFFLPTMVVGPIHRYPAFDRDVRRHHWSGVLISEGLERILYGFVKIAFFGNYLVSHEFARVIEPLPHESLIYKYLQIVQISLNVYFQFSGYSDIAIGFARLLGFRVIENFNWPYFSRNISEFWRRWHISLTTWCREYMYTTTFSLTRSPGAGVLVTLITVALWHEISLRFIAWGAYHAAGLIIWQQWQKVKDWLAFQPPRPVRWVLDGLSIVVTVNFVWMGFLFVLEPNLLEAIKSYARFVFFWV
jgi:D-alanyl-lipoteichoic acid acyltransferase DltB (MBOAT superfamily)